MFGKKPNANQQDIPEVEAKKESTSFSDLDLDLDMDLSFLDDVDETLLADYDETLLDELLADFPEEAPTKKEAPIPAPAVKKTQEAPKAAAVQKPAEVTKSAPVKKPAEAPKTAPVKKPVTPSDTPTVKKPVDTAKTAPVKKPGEAPKTGPVKKPGEAGAAVPGKKPAVAGAAPKKPGAAVPGEKPAAKSGNPAAKSAASKKPAAVPAEPVKNKKKKKKGPRIGGVIFYTLYFLFILAFFLATYLGLNWLNGWLTDYEMAQPTVKAQAVFDQLFTDPDWGALYEAAGAKDSAYEGKEQYVNYMEAKVGSAKLNYMETSAGLSGDKKYLVRLGDEKVASFTLVDKNEVGQASLENLENITDIPDWTLGRVEVFFTREGSYRIEKVDGHVAYVNDVALDDSYTIQIATTKAESYLPEGTTGASICTQEVTGIMELPTVTIYDKNGTQMEVTYDEATRTFVERTTSNTITPEQEEQALEAAKTYCLWMIEEVTDRGKLAKYFDTSAEAYKTITRLGELWMQGHAGYEFVDPQVSKFASYGDDLFSVNVSLNLNVTRKDGTVKPHEFNQNLFFRKNDSGKWLAIAMSNEDIYQPVGKIRLTFMDGETQLTSDFYTTDAKQIITPIIPIPEGKVFSGWVRQTVAEDGTTTLTVMFQPDETGRVAISEGTQLEPMTLYALFEDAAAVEGG